jgi:iron complex transport system ATP-binding protein
VIARALAQEASLLLLDEPTSHLDIQHQVETFRLMLALCRDERLAVLAVVHDLTLAAAFADHDLTLAAAFADRVGLMEDGRISADGPPGDVLSAEAVRRVFGISVRVMPHPDTGRPIIVPDVQGQAAMMAGQVAS